MSVTVVFLVLVPPHLPLIQERLGKVKNQVSILMILKPLSHLTCDLGKLNTWLNMLLVLLRDLVVGSEHHHHYGLVLLLISAMVTADHPLLAFLISVVLVKISCEPFLAGS